MHSTPPSRDEHEAVFEISKFVSTLIECYSSLIANHIRCAPSTTSLLQLDPKLSVVNALVWFEACKGFPPRFVCTRLLMWSSLQADLESECLDSAHDEGHEAGEEVMPAAVIPYDAALKYGICRGSVDLQLVPIYAAKQETIQELSQLVEAYPPFPTRHIRWGRTSI